MTKEEAIKYLQQLYPNGGHCWLDEQRIEAIGMAVNALQEEPVSKDWELSWEDMFTIFRLVNEVLDDYADGKTKKEVGEEVLKRFKAQKGEEV